MPDSKKFLDNNKYDVCRIFIASPSDVKEERNAVDEVVADWNAIHSERECCMLQAVKYDRDVYANTGNYPQKVIDEKYLAKCDFLVGIFWSKIGTSTPGFKSGTIEEITKHCEVGKQGMIYFSQKPYNLKTQKEITEKGKVLNFQKKIHKKAFYKEFSSVDEFKYKLYRDLEQHILGHNPKYVQDQSLPSSVPTAVKEEKASFGDGKHPGEQKVRKIQEVEYTFCWCPADSFWMGSPEDEKDRYDNETRHKVTLSHGFWMLETPVTQKMWENIMGDNPSRHKGSNYPVERVRWNDCQNFIEKMNRKSEIPKGYKAILPSEAQWEYACRAGTDTPFHFGSVLNGDNANCNGRYPYGTEEKGEYIEETTEVKKYSPNNWNLYDMHGNVWEWCSDRYGAYPKEAVTDPTGPNSGSNRVIRGGSWIDGARYCRSANRGRVEPACRSSDLGFRVALVPSK